jgi:hypothetical protein
MVTMTTVALCYNNLSKNNNNNKRSINNKSITFVWETELSLPHVKNFIGCHPVEITYQCSSGLLVFWTSKQKCFKFSMSAPQLQDGSDTKPPQKKS